MKEFSYQWSKLSGQALLDVTERITGMASPSKPRGFLREYLQGMPVNRQWNSSSKPGGGACPSCPIALAGVLGRFSLAAAEVCSV